MKHKITFFRSALLLFLLLIFSTFVVAQTRTAPTDTQTDVTLPVNFTWTAVAGATAYWLRVENDGDITTAPYVADINVGNVTSYSLSGLAMNNTYEWEMWYHDGTSWQGPTAVWTFTTKQYKAGIPTLTVPTDKATLVPVQPTFTWAENGSGVFDTDEEYELLISTDQWFANITHTELHIAYDAVAHGGSLDLSTTPTTLDINSKYYWKVRSKITSATPTVYSPWSSIFLFSTTPAVVKPTETFPISGNLVYTNTPTLYWYTGVVSSSQHFEVWYGPSSAVGTPVDGSGVGSSGAVGGTLVPHATIGSDLNYTIPGSAALASNTDYKWWVRSTDGTNVSDWSDMGEFKTSPTNGGPVKPVGTYPTLNEYQYTNNPTLYWYIITQVTGLQFEVSYTTSSTALPGAGTIVSPATVGTNYFYQLSGLTSSTTYYWWVRSFDGSTYSDWSDKYSFTTTEASGSPVKPVLTYPASGETVYYSDVELHWYATTIASDLLFDLYWGTSSTAPTAATTPTQSGISNLYAVINGLTANQTYYWWVRSTDNAGANPSDWSDMGTFIASESAAQVKVPVIMYPTGGITIAGTDADLSWAYNGNMAGITFAARYSLYPDMTLPTNITLTDPTSTTETLTGLGTGTTYHWQVRATNGTLTSAWTAPAEFATWASTSAPLVVPMVGSPVAGVVVDTENPELSWFLPTQSSNLTYELEYSLSGDFTDAKVISNITKNRFALNNVENGRKYFWRVRSKDGSGNLSTYSAIGTFVGHGVTAVEEENIIPEKFEVSQNYPNPFNPSTMIKYALPEAQFVTLRIYNMLGQEVATLVNNQVEAGTYNVTWNGVDNSGAKVATGTYIYRIVAGNNIITKKMILLK
jgi:hypothetical protein